MKTQFVAPVHDPGGSLGRFLQVLQTLTAEARRPSGAFLLAVGSTQTSDVPGISAAGSTPEMRRLTPAVDAEALVLGRTVSGDRIPVSPAGIVSPVVITRASLPFLDCRVTVVDCGSFRAPAIPCFTLGTQVARCLSTGAALDKAHAEHLFQRGFELGEELRQAHEYILLAECVPGGTSTALSVLTALGYPAHGMLSSSLPRADHSLRKRLVDQGMQRASLSPQAARSRPLSAVAALGDPVQPVVAGVALAASKSVPVVLAGGSQMLAVWALISALARQEGIDLGRLSLAVITTRWVAFDASAACRRLAEIVDAPFAASCPDFHRSRHAGLRAYEVGHVKEGVGAGAAMAAAHVIGSADDNSLLEAIDCSYDELVLGVLPSPNAALQ